ncbi:uncharacterized protein [Clytia hemisphaerica]|uniref:TNFR-Cys domain-containing protein n=1 Tax=Clytia hemisphaerica TaxID=252671 RepID=A0A7M6DL96_9CNID
MKEAFIIFLLLVASYLMKVVNATQYFPCPTCPKGQGLNEPTVDSHHCYGTTKCIPCELGVNFNEYDNSMRLCSNCSKCGDNEVATQNCTLAQNYICDCLPGFGRNSIETCTPCCELYCEENERMSARNKIYCSPTSIQNCRCNGNIVISLSPTDSTPKTTATPAMKNTTKAVNHNDTQDTKVNVTVIYISVFTVLAISIAAFCICRHYNFKNCRKSTPYISTDEQVYFDSNQLETINIVISSESTDSRNAAPEQDPHLAGVPENEEVEENKCLLDNNNDNENSGDGDVTRLHEHDSNDICQCDSSIVFKPNSSNQRIRNERREEVCRTCQKIRKLPPQAPNVGHTYNINYINYQTMIYARQDHQHHTTINHLHNDAEVESKTLSKADIEKIESGNVTLLANDPKLSEKVKSYSLFYARDKLIKPYRRLDNWIKEDPKWQPYIEAFLRDYLNIEMENVREIMQKDQPVDMFFVRLRIKEPEFPLEKFMAWLEVIGYETLVQRILDIVKEHPVMNPV